MPSSCRRSPPPSRFSSSLLLNTHNLAFRCRVELQRFVVEELQASPSITGIAGTGAFSMFLILISGSFSIFGTVISSRCFSSGTPWGRTKVAADPWSTKRSPEIDMIYCVSLRIYTQVYRKFTMLCKLNLHVLGLCAMMSRLIGTTVQEQQCSRRSRCDGSTSLRPSKRRRGQGSEHQFKGLKEYYATLLL